MTPRLVLLLFVASCITCCSQPAKTKKEGKDSKESKEGVQNEQSFSYDYAHPTKRWMLPHSLKEISGNSWIDNDHLVIIEDLHPNLYLLKLGDSAVVEKMIPFGESTEKKFDIEDVTVVGDVAYALWSHGTVYKISNWNSKPTVKQIPTSLSKENNTEGICFDPVTGHLLISCKKESEMADEKKSTRSIFAYDMKSDTLIPDPFLLIHSGAIKKILGEKVEFFPSAVAVHPKTHEVFVLSTRDNKCIARYTHEGKLESVEFLDKDLLPQPEGICFSPEGKLYISSEGKHGEAPRIVEYDVKTK